MEGTMKKPELPVRKIIVGDYEFVVENYSGRKAIGVGNSISSDEFELCGHRWVVQFFPEGKDAAAHDGGFASLEICLRSECAEAEPVQLLIELFLVNHLGKASGSVSSFYNHHVSYLCSRGTLGKPDLLRAAELESPKSGFLKNDSLFFRVRVGVFTYHSVTQQRMPPVSADFSELLRSQWQDEFAYFHVAPLTFCAAKSILAARWPALLSYLPDERHLQDAVFSDVDYKAFMVMLSFVYDGIIFIFDERKRKAFRFSDPENLESVAAKILRAAQKLELKAIREPCELILSKKISIESVASLLQLADDCNAAHLKSACLTFAAQNRSAIVESDAGEYLKETCPLLFLDLAGFEDTSSSSKEGILSRIVSTARESLVTRRCSWGEPHDHKHKLKEF